MDTRMEVAEVWKAQDGRIKYRILDPQVDGVEVEFIVDRWARKPKKTRVYVDAPEVVGYEDLDAPNEDGVYGRYDAAKTPEYRRRNAINTSDWKKRAIAALADSDFDVSKMKFSFKAGCRCGCSPGFVNDAVLRFDGKPVDSVYVRVVPDEALPEAEGLEALDLVGQAPALVAGVA